MRGCFIRGDGVELPNNLTDFGINTVLQSFLQGVAKPTIYAGLVDAVFATDMTLADVLEPAIGTGGYARQGLAYNNTDWPVVGSVNGVQFVESKAIVFPATGAYSRIVSRITLVTSLSTLTGPVFCLGSTFPTNLSIDASTDVSLRTFKYRLYGR